MNLNFVRDCTQNACLFQEFSLLNSFEFLELRQYFTKNSGFSKTFSSTVCIFCNNIFVSAISKAVFERTFGHNVLLFRNIFFNCFFSCNIVFKLIASRVISKTTLCQELLLSKTIPVAFLLRTNISSLHHLQNTFKARVSITNSFSSTDFVEFHQCFQGEFSCVSPPYQHFIIKSSREWLSKRDFLSPTNSFSNTSFVEFHKRFQGEFCKL